VEATKGSRENLHGRLARPVNLWFYKCGKTLLL
jgi:hypothetical protein